MFIRFLVNYRKLMNYGVVVSALFVLCPILVSMAYIIEYEPILAKQKQALVFVHVWTGLSILVVIFILWTIRQFLIEVFAEDEVVSSPPSIRELLNECKDLGWIVSYDDDGVVLESLPEYDGTEKTLGFFELPNRGHVPDQELAQEYSRQGLIPADPMSFLRWHIHYAQTVFTDGCCYGVHWQDSQGRWCGLTVRKLDDGQQIQTEVHLGHTGHRWVGPWRIAAVTA